MSDPASPRAARLNPPRWLDTRLVLGVLLILVSVVVGARLLSSADDTSPVYVASHDLVPGQHLAADDLRVANVRLGTEGGSYVAVAGPAPSGYVVARYVGAGELVPAGALTAPDAARPSRLVTVPVEPGHLPDELARGSLVDVYLTPHAGAGGPVPAPTLVASALPVEAREGGARTFSANASLSVVLSVPQPQVPRLVHAVEAGAIDLVVLPSAATARQSPAPSSSP